MNECLQSSLCIKTKPSFYDSECPEQHRPLEKNAQTEWEHEKMVKWTVALNDFLRDTKVLFMSFKMLRDSKLYLCIFPISSPVQLAQLRNILQHLPRCLKHLISGNFKFLLNNQYISAKRISTTLSSVGVRQCPYLGPRLRDKQIGHCISFLLLL